MHVMVGQRLEKLVDATRDATGTGEPVAARYNRFQSPDLEVLFDVNGEEVRLPRVY
jgi:hypothetical protein